MTNYLESINEDLKKYYQILSNEFPQFLIEYINTPAMLKQAEISVSCGTFYSKMFDQIWYSSLDHSIGVALIIWNFTKDKKQTISGLLHDIATPVFKHSIDFMNKDYEKQESTEELTTKIIMESNEIMELLKRDNISIEEVCNYHIYPIADNETPKLSSDRLEYTLSNGLGVTDKIWNLEDVERVYKNIEIQKNETNSIELGFKDKTIAELFVNTMSKLSCLYRRDKTIFSMQFLAEILKKMIEKRIIELDDLYKMTEKEIINNIENCNDKNISECFEKWKKAQNIKTSNRCPKNVYYVNVEKNKVRYINPLVKLEEKYVRLKDISKKANKDIQKAINYEGSKYIYLDFKFNE